MWKPGPNQRKKVDPETMKTAVRRVLEDGTSVRAVAQEYDIDRKTLGRYVIKIQEGQDTKFKANHNSSQIFTNEEEAALEKYLITASKLNYGLTPKDLRRFGYEYALASGTRVPANWQKNRQASKDWERGYMYRHKERLSLRCP